MNKVFWLTALLAFSAMTIHAQEDIYGMQENIGRTQENIDRTPEAGRGRMTFSGEVSSGLAAHFNDKENGDAFIQAAGSDGVAARIKFSGEFDGKNNNYGFAFTLIGDVQNSADSGSLASMNLNFERALGYLKMFNGILKFTGGYWVDPKIWESPGGIGTDLGMGGAGLMIDIAPVSGLNIMLSGWAKAEDTTLFQEGKYMIGADYTLQDIFRVMALFASRQYGLTGFSKFADNNDDVTNTYGPGGSSTWDELAANDHRISFAVDVLALKKFGFSRLAIDTAVYNLGGGRRPNWDDTKLIKVTPFFLGQRIAWEWQGLGLEGRFYQRFNINDDRWNYGPSFRMRADVKYSLTDLPVGFVITPKLGFNLVVNSDAWGDNPVDMRFDESVNWEDCARGKGGWGLNPAVEFHIGSFAALELGYSLKVNTSEEDTALPPVPVTEKSTVNHAIYLFIKVIGR